MATRSITTSTFAGSVPRRADHLAAFSQAVKAVDCKLWHGTLEAWREPRLLHTTPPDTKSVYQSYAGCWLSSTTCASFAEGSIEQKHVFATGYNGLPYPVRIEVGEGCDDCEVFVRRLGLPCPELDFTLTHTDKKSRSAAPRQYMVQWEDSYGNRSAGSNPSQMIYVAEGDAVLLSGWAPPLAAGWDIQNIIILRSSPGFDNSFAEEKNALDAAWMVVDIIPAAQSSYVDTKHAADLFEALIEDDVYPPPAGLQGITWVQSMNCLAGFSGNKLYFSRNNNYNDWSEGVSLDDNVRAIVESNDVIYVATDGSPYVVEGSADCDTAACRKVIRFPEALPIVNRFHGMTELPNGAAYASHNGIVVISGKSTPQLLTSALYAPDDWQALHPDTARVEYFEGMLFCFCRKGAFVVGLKVGAGYTGELDSHTELSLRPDETLVTRKGQLVLRVANELLEWNRGAQLMPYRYETGVQTLNTAIQMGAAHLRMSPGSVNVKVKVDGHTALDETALVTTEYRLPMWAYGSEFQVILEGTARIKTVAIAPSMKDL